MIKKKSNRSFQEINELALKVRAQYLKMEKKKYGKQRTAGEIMQGFVVDVGDLTREVMKQSGIRDGKDRQKLIHELCDCLYSVLVLADKYKVNLEKEFPENMRALSEKINSN